jgi:hypothetical protein
MLTLINKLLTMSPAIRSAPATERDGASREELDLSKSRPLYLNNRKWARYRGSRAAAASLPRERFSPLTQLRHPGAFVGLVKLS